MGLEIYFFSDAFSPVNWEPEKENSGDVSWRLNCWSMGFIKILSEPLRNGVSWIFKLLFLPMTTDTPCRSWAFFFSVIRFRSEAILSLELLVELELLLTWVIGSINSINDTVYHEISAQRQYPDDSYCAQQTMPWISNDVCVGDDPRLLVLQLR